MLLVADPQELRRHRRVWSVAGTFPPTEREALEVIYDGQEQSEEVL